jgi:hypothetical protein
MQDKCIEREEHWWRRRSSTVLRLLRRTVHRAIWRLLMLIDMSVAPQALAEVSEGRPPVEARRNHEQLRNVLRAHGSLLFSNQAESIALLRALSSGELSPSEVIRWREFLLELKNEGRVTIATPTRLHGLEEEVTRQTFEQEWTARSSSVIAVLSRAVFGRIFPETTDEVHEVEPNVFAATRDAMVDCPPLAKVSQLEQIGNFVEGTDRETIWREVIGPLARHTRSITIFDRYLFNALSLRGRARRSHESAEHVEWLLDKINREGRSGIVVRLFAGTGATPPIQDAQDAANLLDRTWARSTGRISEVECHGVDWDVLRGPKTHNRHIRFGDSSALGVSEGLDRLRHERIRGSDGFTYSYKWTVDAVKPMRVNERAVSTQAGLTRARFSP